MVLTEVQGVCWDMASQPTAKRSRIRDCFQEQAVMAQRRQISGCLGHAAVEIPNL